MIMKKIKKILSYFNILRFNIKIIPDLWVLRPYKEEIFYTVDKEHYTPVSYRFLCFSFVIVRADTTKVQRPNTR